MLRSILIIFIIEFALIYGIVTHVSEPSQNVVGMNVKFWVVRFQNWDCNCLWPQPASKVNSIIFGNKAWLKHILQGTIWYSLFKYEPILEVAKLMDYDAMGVGK